MAKSTVLPFEQPSQFSPDPLTEVIQAGAKALLGLADPKLHIWAFEKTYREQKAS